MFFFFKLRLIVLIFTIKYVSNFLGIFSGNKRKRRQYLRNKKFVNDIFLSIVDGDFMSGNWRREVAVGAVNAHRRLELWRRFPTAFEGEINAFRRREFPVKRRLPVEWRPGIARNHKVHWYRFQNLISYWSQGDKTIKRKEEGLVSYSRFIRKVLLEMNFPPLDLNNIFFSHDFVVKGIIT